jgi:hypothetical protein
VVLRGRVLLGERPEQLFEHVIGHVLGRGRGFGSLTAVTPLLDRPAVRRRNRRAAPHCAATKPVCSPAPRLRTCSITARTSAAVAVSSAWMKLACFSLTKRPADAQAAQAQSVDQRTAAGSSPGTGLTNTEPAFCPPGWCLPTPADDLAEGRALAGGASPVRGAGDERRAPPDDRPARSRGSAGRVLRRGDPTGVGRGPVRRSSTCTRPGRRAMSLPCPPAFIRTATTDRPWDAHGPLEPGKPAAAVRRSDGNAKAPPAARPRHRPCTDCVVELDPLGTWIGERDGDARRNPRRPPTGSNRGRR